MPQESPNETRQGLRTILIATDFSAASERARDYAICLAAPSTSVTLLHVNLLPLPDRTDPALVPGWTGPEQSLQAQALERLHHFGGPARAAGLATKLVLQEGLPAEVILALADTLQPDLIAMGTHGRRGFERLAMGSNADRVVRLASAPVLTVGSRGLEPPTRIREVLCPLSLEGDAQTVALAGALAGRCGASLTVMHVLESAFGQAPGRSRDEKARERLQDAVAAQGRSVRVRALVLAGNPSHEILRVASERAANLIVIGVHDRLPVSRNCLGRTSDQVGREASCAVIRVRPAVEKASREAPEARLASV
jgi:nucleotide-binding universal stress UspA family protein